MKSKTKRIAAVFAVIGLIMGAVIFAGRLSPDAGEDLLRAAYEGELPAVKKLLHDHPDLVNAPSRKFTQRNSVAEKLRRFGVTAKSALAFLPERSATHFELLENLGATPLHLAVDLQRVQVVEFLLANGADLEAKDGFGTPLFHAFNLRSVKMQKVLLAHHPRLTDKWPYGFTPLHYAAELGETEIAEMLLRDHVDANATNIFGGMARHLAVQHSQTNFVKFLLEHGADAQFSAAMGGTPLALAATKRKPDPEIIRLLRTHGAQK